MSDTDLPQQPETLQQQPSIMKKNKNPIWRVIFILLLTINVIFVSWAVIVMMYGYHGTADLEGLFVLFCSLPLAIIDLIALLFYGFTQRPHGIARVISSTVLILVCLPLIFALVLFVIIPNVMYFLGLYFNSGITH
jgi:hypothetical protein